MEKRIKVLDSFIEILENTSDPSDKTDQLIDAFLSLYPTESDTTIRLILPTLSNSNEFIESKRKEKSNFFANSMVRSFLKRGNPFPPTTTKIKDKSKVLGRRQEVDSITAVKREQEHEEIKKEEESILENMKRPHHVEHTIKTSEGDSNTKRQDFKHMLLAAIGKQNGNLNQTICQLCISRINFLLFKLVRNSVIANKGLISLEVSNFLKGARPTIVHSEESDHQLVEEQLKDFGILKNDLNKNEPQTQPIDPVVNNAANIDKRSLLPMTCTESMVEGYRSCVKMTVAKSSTSFCFDHETPVSSENINQIEKSFTFKGSMELNLINQIIPISFSTNGKLIGTFSSSSTSHPKEFVITLAIKSLYDSIIDAFSKSLKQVIMEKNKIRLEDSLKKTTRSATETKTTLSKDKKRKSNGYVTVDAHARNVKRRSYQNRIPHTTMPLRPSYINPLAGQYPNPISNYNVHSERRQSGLDSLGEAAEAVWLAEEAMMRRDSYRSQGGRPSYSFPAIESPNQKFISRMSHYSDPYLRESSNTIRQAYGTSDPYGYIEPRRLSRMSRRQSNDSMTAAIDTVYLAELEADRRQRSSLHEAMRLLDATSNRSSDTNTMVAAAADAARFAEMEEMRRQSFLSNDSNELYDHVSRVRSRQYSVDSFSAPLFRRQSAGPESILSAAEAVRLAEMRRSSGGIDSSMHSAAELVRLSDQQNLMNSQANPRSGFDPNDYGGAYMNSFGGTHANFSVNDMNHQIHYMQPGAQNFPSPMNYVPNAPNDRESMNHQQQVHFQNQMGI